jgi:hypothetical protein
MESDSEKQEWSLIAPENIAMLWTAIRQEFNPQIYSEWLDLFAEQPDLWPQMELWLEQMADQFL